MSEEKEKIQPEKPGLDDKKTNALLRYVAIMFAVAFLLVLFSLVSQMRDSKNTISQLNQSSSSAVQKAEQLQDNNRLLEENNELLKGELEDLEEDVAALQQQLEDTRAQMDEAPDAEAAKAAEREKVQEAYDLLYDFMQNPTEENKAKVERHKQDLSEEMLTVYRSIEIEKGE